MSQPPRSTSPRRSLRPVAAVAAAAALTAGALAAVPADAHARSQSYPVPASGAYTVHGHGFGHGHGMSQYGAYAAARQGLDHRRILDFYYPGTTWGRVRGGVRVLITADTTPDLVVSPAAGLVLRDLGSSTTYRLPDVAGLTRWRLAVKGTRTVVRYDAGGWHRYRPGGRAALAGDGQLSADGPLTLWTPSGRRVYRGGLRSASPSPGSADRDTVNVLAMDRYLRGVVAAEMPASWSSEALQAQAVAARTYATWSRDQFPDRSWQICDTTSCQVYRGVAAEDPRTTAAVVATKRRVLTYGGAAAFTQFGSSSGGWTSAGSRPYLVARRDPYDDSPVNPVHDWSVRLTAGRIRHAYPGIGRLRRLVVTSRDGHGQWGGRVQRIVLDGRRKDVALSGDAFRAVFGLRSTWFAP